MPNRIRELREEKRMTQLRLSVELGVAQETVSAYETGKHDPSLQSLLKLSDLFHASMDYIMGRSEVRLPVQLNAGPPTEAAMLTLFRSLDAVQKEKAMAFMRGLQG